MRGSFSRATVFLMAAGLAIVTSGCGASAEVWKGPSQTVTAQPGPKHCGEEEVLFLTLDGQEYLYDPGAAIPRQYLSQEPQKSVALPADATDTGLRHGKDSLWLGAEGDALYLVSGDSAQLWPLVVEEFGCD